MINVTVLAACLHGQSAKQAMTTAPGKIGHRELAKLSQRGEIIWDAELKGFGARKAENCLSFILMYRNKEGRQRFYTIGKVGSPWTPFTAREKAKELLYQVHQGLDPASEKISARRADTVEDLCTSYMEEVEAGRLRIRRGGEKKASTIEGDKSRIRCHIVPLLGRRSIAAVTQADVEQFMFQIARDSGKSGASRTVGLLGAIFHWGVKHKMRPDNPCRGVERFADKVRKRRLTDAEYAAIGAAIRKANYQWPSIPAAAKFLILTGWRSSEALTLRRADVDFGRRTATLGDTKTGRSIRPLAHRAIEILRGVQTAGDLFFPTPSGRKYRANYLGKMFRKLIGDLPEDVTPHVLRHSFASLAAEQGLAEATVAALLGHVGRTMTSRYQHSSDPALLKAADMVADATAALMRDELAQGAVVQLRSVP
jgi:integrase